MAVEKIIGEWKKKVFKPVYWFEGDEPFFIDQLTHYAENRILNEAEVSFNLTIFYGKDASWSEVINACRRYPMFAERQVVLLKEAQQMREIDKLEGYIAQPLSSTILIVAMKDKKLDGRSKLVKLLKTKGEILTLKKLYDNELPQWIQSQVQSKGCTIDQKAGQLLIAHIGNDLSRLNNEIEKVLINTKNQQHIACDDIEKYVGISKEYNLFELQYALMSRNLSKAIQIIQYFESNPKAAPIQSLLPTLYAFFSKVYLLFGIQTNNEQEVAKILGVHPFFVKQYYEAARNYRQKGIEQAILLLHEYNLRSIGIGSATASDTSLMKEMIVKIIS